MVIKENLLYSMGANSIMYSAGETIFSEGAWPAFYYQIIKGEAKLNNYNEDGKETIQIIIEDGQSIGESLLFMEKPYPMNAIAITECEVVKLSRKAFLNLLRVDAEISYEMNKCLSQRLYFKLIMNQNLSTQSPILKLVALMDYLKSFAINQQQYSFRVPLTRQQMAGLTGLCVETTIRTIKGMERAMMLKIENRKIMY
ncbi:Crp/Fnr family transcriptional regulator [Chryseobacterium sp. ES2]|uniref:Crp/Fnr family transcriptional regulator n=1 Tax=Chryseobacterium metallicongregator TaxID=3073042 RepID=A0ABU1E729_9FLAO|nr:Crp/Fnr family transcriptional regulator [Chryseobacterium sp. ES2]MDR4953609.1 Crp/Fnr family transcriptional regulator [Chryseobacterium sp. ES2]